MPEAVKPVICPCACVCDFLSKFDENVYDIENEDTFLKAFFDVVCMEFCDLLTAKQRAKNDFYLWKDIEDEAVVKGEADGIDCFSCKTVVDIISVGDTIGGSDYEEGIDYTIHPCGIEWIVSPSYYYSGTARNAREPEEGETYYVTYRCGVRNEKLYDVFGAIVGLIKKDYQTYPDYREAIKSLIQSYILGATIEGMKEGLSVLIPKENIEILESFRIGWEMNVSFLYTKEDFDDATVDTSDGTILKTVGEDFVFDVIVSNSELLNDRDLFEDIVDKLKPAHTIGFVVYL
jgi:hypothetical protein